MNQKVRVIITILIYALAVLSVAAGVPKIMQQPQELGFLSALGLPKLAVSVMGVVQVLGGLLLLASKSRLIGAVLAAFALGVSSAAIFAAGNISFGLISLLPLCVAGLVVFVLLRSGRSTE